MSIDDDDTEILNSKPSDRSRVLLEAGGAAASGSRWSFSRLAPFLKLPVSPQILAVICLICLGLTTSWIWIELKERFPRLPEGSYVGSVYDVFEDSGPTSLFVESTVGGDLYMVVLRDEWLPPEWATRPVSMVAKGDGGSQSQWVLPLALPGPERELLVFTGNQTGPGSFLGVVKAGNGERGRWTLKQVRSSESSLNTQADLKRWLRAKVQLGVAAGLPRAYWPVLAQRG